jgi:hypothetical protein
MGYLRSPNLALGLAAFLFTLTPMIVSVLPTVAETQTAASALAKADRLLQEANQLALEPSTLLQALPKYRNALGMYENLGNPTRALAVRQKLATALVTARPLLDQQEQEIQIAIDTFFNRYSAKTNNDTAQKLKVITEKKLGFDLWSSAQESNVSVAEAKAFSAIRQSLDEQIKLQMQGNKAIPQNLQDYLASHAIAIKEIYALLRESEIPEWEMDLTGFHKGNFATPFPSFLGLVTLNDLILLDAINKFQNYNTTEGLEALDASWRLRTSLNDDPRLISQLVNLIIASKQINIMRNLEGVSLEWQKRLLQIDYASLIITSLEMEAFSKYAGYNQMFKADGILPLSSTFYWRNWPETMRQDYSRWSLLDMNLSSRRIYAELPKLNACKYDINATIAYPGIDDYLTLNYPIHTNQWLSGKKLMLQSELTQKVLAVRELIAQRKVPKSLPSSTSVICPTHQWNYTVAPEEIKIALSPSTSLIQSKGELPFSYTISIKSPRE